MKINKNQLKSMIMEELQSVLNEIDINDPFFPKRAQPALSSPTLSPEEARAISFKGAGDYTYAQDPRNPGSFYFSGPGGKTGYAKAGTPEARSIQAEMDTGTSLYQAPTQQVDEFPFMTDEDFVPYKRSSSVRSRDAAGRATMRGDALAGAAPMEFSPARRDIEETIYEALLEEFGK